MITNTSKLRQYIVYALAGLLAIYFLTFTLYRLFLNPQDVKRRIVSQLGAQIQRKITLDDNVEFRISWDLAPHVRLHNVTVANFAQSTQPIMLSVKTLDLKFSLLKLLSKQIHVSSVKFDTSNLVLETTDGQNNWDFKQTSQIAKGNSNFDFSVGRVSIVDGIITYTKDKNPPDQIEIKKLAMISEGTLRDFKLSATGSYNNIPVDLDAVVSSINDNQTQFVLDKLDIKSNHITGRLLIKHNPTSISGEFQIPVFDTNDFTNKNNSNNGEYSVPHVQLPLQYLQNVDVDLPIKIKTLTLDKIVLNDANIYIQANNNVVHLTFKPPVNYAEGTINADLTYDLKANPATLNFSLNSTHLNFETILNSVMTKSPISGSYIDLNANLHSAGNSLYDIVANLKGHILATAGPGQYINSNAGMTDTFSTILSGIITFDKRQPSTTFTCGVVNFQVDNGIAYAKNGIGFEAASVHVLGNGQLDLRNGRIDFSITPKTTLSTSSIDVSQFNIAQLVSITGTVSKPQVSLNPMGVIGSAASIAGTGMIANMAGAMAGPAGIAAVVAKNMMDSGKNNDQVSPCKTALGS